MQDVALLVQWAAGQGYGLTGGDLYRDKEYAVLYPSGLASKHHARMAIDLNLFIDGEYQPSTEAHRPLGEFWKGIREANTWGGDFDDGNHYSRDER